MYFITAIIITIITIIIIIRSNQRLGGAIKIHVKGETNSGAIINSLRLRYLTPTFAAGSVKNPL